MEHSQLRGSLHDYFASPVNVFSVPNLDHPDRKLLVLNGIDDSVPALPNAVSFPAGQFFVAQWPRVGGERLDLMENPSEVLLWYYGQVFFDGFFEKDPIFGHLFLVF